MPLAPAARGPLRVNAGWHSDRTKARVSPTFTPAPPALQTVFLGGFLPRGVFEELPCLRVRRVGDTWSLGPGWVPTAGPLEGEGQWTAGVLFGEAGSVPGPGCCQGRGHRAGPQMWPRQSSREGGCMCEMLSSAHEPEYMPWWGWVGVSPWQWVPTDGPPGHLASQPGGAVPSGPD